MERKLRAMLPSGRFENVPDARARAMRAVRRRGNRSTEARFRALLVRAGIRGWTMHAGTVHGNPDFYFPASAIAVFVDGCFWHGCPKCGHVPKTNSEFWKAKIERNQERDRRNRRRLREQGVKAVRFWEHELRDSALQCVRQVIALLDSQT